MWYAALDIPFEGVAHSWQSALQSSNGINTWHCGSPEEISVASRCYMQAQPRIEFCDISSLKAERCEIKRNNFGLWRRSHICQQGWGERNKMGAG